MNINRIILLLSIIAFLCSISLTLFFPIYPDEIAYKIFLERHFISGGFKESMALFCNEGFLYKVQWPFVPASQFWSAINFLGIGWWSYRVTPLIFLSSMLVLISLYNINNKSKDYLPLFLIPTIGTCMYGLTLLRAEIIILLGAVVLFLLGECLVRSKNFSSIILCILSLLFCIDIVTFVHPKAIYLVAIPIVAALLTIGQWRRSKSMRMALFGFICINLVIAIYAIQMHQAQYVSCALIPGLQARMSQQAINPLSIFTDPYNFLKSLEAAFSMEKIIQTFERVSYAETFQSNYLPPISDLTAFEIGINYCIKASIIITTLYLVFKIIYLIKNKNINDNKKLYLILSTILALLLPFLLNITKHFYEISFFLASLTIGLALLWPFRFLNSSKFATYLENILFFSLIIVSLSSTLINTINFSTKFINGYEGPSQSFNENRVKLKVDVDELFSQAGVASQDSIIVDDLTYDLVSDYPIVAPVTYLTIMAADAPNLVLPFLNKYKIQYGIIQCHTIPVLRTRIDLNILSVVSYGQYRSESSSQNKDICFFNIPQQSG